jgi:hypothetical protein
MVLIMLTTSMIRGGHTQTIVTVTQLFRLRPRMASGQSLGQRHIPTPRGTLGGPVEQVWIRLEVGVQTQGGAAHHDSDAVTVSGRGELSRNQSPQPSQRQWWGALAAHLTVERMRHTHFHATVNGFDVNEGTHIGLLDRRRLGDRHRRDKTAKARWLLEVDEGWDNWLSEAGPVRLTNNTAGLCNATANSSCHRIRTLR